MYPIESRLREIESVAGLGRVFIAVHHVKKDGACTCGRETCDSQGKHPIDRGWQAPGAQHPAHAVERWYRDGRNAGIVTGAETGLLLLDLDNEDAVCWFEERNQDAPFFMVRTGRGAHVYYRHPGWDVRNSAGALAPGVDVRGERGFVVAPGSIHRNGRMYAVDTESQDEPQPVPGWLDEALKQASRPRAQAPQTRTDADGLIREGGRNDAVFKIASSLRAQGLGYEAILASLRATNETAVVPPLEDRVLVDIAERVVDGYQAGTPARRIKIGLASGLKVEQPEGDEKKGIQPDDIARAYIEATADKPLVQHRGFWLQFNGKCYEVTTEEEVGKAVLGRMQQAPELVSKCKRAFVADVVANLAPRVSIPKQVELGGWTTGEGPLSIVARNGIVDVDAYLAERDDWLKPHDPDLLATVCLPFDVDPEADCPLWMSVLEKIMPDDETRTRLQQWFGLNMVPDISHQLAAILVGDGSNGKSTVLEILGDLVGRGNYSTVPLERFGERFDLAAMVGKSANIAHEMGEIDKAAEGVLKQLISGEEMTFERKHKDPYQARPTARLTFSTNVLPRFADRTDAIWRRLLIFPFNVKIRQEEKDYKILDKLRVELPGIFNWAICGLDLVKAHGIGESLEMSNIKAKYREGVNPFLQWADERLKETGFGVVEVSKLYEDYRSWCGAHGCYAFAVRNFEAEIERHYKKEIKRPGTDGPRPRVVEGLRLH